MLNAHGIGTLTPAPEIFGCEEPLHFLDDVGLGETGLLLDLLEGDAVGPGGPNKPGIGADRRLGSFSMCNAGLGSVFSPTG